MKKGLVLFAALLMVASFALVAHGQGSLGFPGLGRAQSLGGGTCDPCALPLFEPPTLFVGWMDSYKLRFSFDAADPGGVFGDAHSWRVSGLWLGMEERINLSENCGINLDGWVLIPSNRQGEVSEGIIRNIVTITIIGDPIIITTITPTPGIGNRSWNTRTDWWYVDAAADFACCTGLKALAGFRYDHFSTRFDNPSSDSLPSTSADTADITVNSYLPYVGIQSRLGGPASNVNVRLIGFPWAPANVSHFETSEAGIGTRVETTGNFDKSYFLELFAEYNRNLFGDASMGAFFRWNVLHGHANLSSDVLPGLGSTSSGGSFDRNTYTFGGSLALNFRSPF